MLMFSFLLLSLLVQPISSMSVFARQEREEESVGTDIPLRSVKSVFEDADAFWKRYRRAEDDEQLVGAVRQMCALYREVVADPRLADSRGLANIQRTLQQRLVAIQKRLQKNQATSDSLEQRTEEQEQQASYGDFADVADKLAEQIGLANQMTGGPAQIFAYASGQHAGLPDHGPELVRLIEETVQPDFWERNGGPGRIFYYKPLRVIVVGGTIEVHQNLDHLLRGLRMLDR